MRPYGSAWKPGRSGKRDRCIACSRVSTPPQPRRIHARDVHKTIRALEIRLLTRSSAPPPETAEPLSGYRVIQIGLDPDRAELALRLDARVERMFAQGLIEEVRGLLGRGATGAEKPFESLGYKQALQLIRGEITRDQAILSTQTGTRQYAKRQRTWFLRDARIHWLAGFGDRAETVQAALDLLAQDRVAQDRLNPNRLN